MRIRRRTVELIAVAAFVALAAAGILRPGEASAHPLGNFTINHYTRIDVAPDGIHLFRVLDMAEIPAFQERQRIDANGDGALDAAETEAWATARIVQLRDGMTLAVNGDDVALTPASYVLTFPDGQGGLTLLRLTVTYDGALPDGWRDRPPPVEFTDRNDTDRIGWREVIVRGAPGVDIAGSTAPAVDVSGELLHYPEDQLASPLDVRAATFSFLPGAGSVTAPTRDADQQRATRANPDGTLARFTDLVAREQLSVGVVLLALLAATGFGALHALSPGHGKTIVAAYLIGSRGTAKHALLLGLVVTATHTSSVYALGFITLYLSEFIVPERLYPWLGISSGALIVVMGVSLFIGRLRSSGLAAQAVAWMRGRTPVLRRSRTQLAFAGESGAIVLGATPPHTHDGDASHDHAHASGAAHTHDHDADGDDHEDAAAPHKHGWGLAHSHRIPGQDGEPVTWRRLVGLGVFGGLLPCPSAIVVMLSAIALHRVEFGLLLIVFFSLGLAGVLTGIGFALVYSRAIMRRVPLLQRLADRASNTSGLASLAVRAFPTAGAAAVVVAGTLITLRAALAVSG